MKMTSTTWWVIGLLLLIAGLIGWSTMLQAPAAPTSSEASAILAVAADDHVRGAVESPVVLVEYLDFECPSCRAYFPVLTQMEEEFGDRVTFVVRYFPINGHRNGVSSALAVEAASRQGKFWEMHDLLYARQDEWGGKQVETPEVFEAYAQELGLDVAQFKTDMASEEARARVKRDQDGARIVDVNGTPSFFLNGVKLSNPSSPEAFRALIQAELDAQPAQ